MRSVTAAQLNCYSPFPNPNSKGATHTTTTNTNYSSSRANIVEALIIANHIPSIVDITTTIAAIPPWTNPNIIVSNMQTINTGTMRATTHASAHD